MSKIKKDWKAVREGKQQDQPIQEELMEETEQLETPSMVLEHPSYEELEEKLTLAEQQAHENWEKSVRALAELENGRRRAERDIANAHRYGLEKFVKSLLPVLDSFEQALQLAEQSVDETMHEGLELTMKLFCDVLQRFGVEALDPQGQPFDPQYHEAMSMQESDEVEPNTVITVFQKGYKLSDRVIRPARVIVAKSKSS